LTAVGIGWQQIVRISLHGESYDKYLGKQMVVKIELITANEMPAGRAFRAKARKIC